MGEYGKNSHKVLPPPPTHTGYVPGTWDSVHRVLCIQKPCVNDYLLCLNHANEPRTTTSNTDALFYVANLSVNVVTAFLHAEPSHLVNDDSDDTFSKVQLERRSFIGKGKRPLCLENN